MRRSEIVKVPAHLGGRDAGKHFLITEMSALKAEKWAARALLLLSGSGERIPDSIAGRGMEAVAVLFLNIFLQGAIRFDQLEPLLDEMFECVQIIRDPKAVDKQTGHPVPHALISDDDIEEVATRAWLRSEVLRIHTGFSPADALSGLISVITKPSASATI